MNKQGYSNYRIGKELGISHITVGKYVRKFKETGEALPPTQVDRVLPPLAADGSDYQVAQSLTATLGLLNSVKTHCLNLALKGEMPAQVTPLMIKQLAETERLILTLPQDLNKGRRDLYEQIQSRRLEGSDDEIAELGEAGEMGAN